MIIKNFALYNLNVCVLFFCVFVLVFYRILYCSVHHMTTVQLIKYCSTRSWGNVETITGVALMCLQSLDTIARLKCGYD